MRTKTLNAIKKHALAEYPRESCGLVILKEGQETYFPCKNLSKGEGNFVMCPRDYAKAEDSGKIVMVVHSHPDESCEPSEADRIMCGETQLPWFIISVYRDLLTDKMVAEDYKIIHPTDYVAPLEGRVWEPPVLDCYSLIRDYYKQELDISIPDYAPEERAGHWWEEEGESLYVKYFEDAGFVRVDGPVQKHDVIIMEISSKAGPNHAGIYLGDETGYFLHHMYGYLSGKAMYGGYWLRNTSFIVRHKDLM